MCKFGTTLLKYGDSNHTSVKEYPLDKDEKWLGVEMYLNTANQIQDLVLVIGKISC